MTRENLGGGRGDRFARGEGSEESCRAHVSNAEGGMLLLMSAACACWQVDSYMGRRVSRCACIMPIHTAIMCQNTPSHQHQPMHVSRLHSQLSQHNPTILPQPCTQCLPPLDHCLDIITLHPCCLSCCYTTPSVARCQVLRVQAYCWAVSCCVSPAHDPAAQAVTQRVYLAGENDCQVLLLRVVHLQPTLQAGHSILQDARMHTYIHSAHQHREASLIGATNNATGHIRDECADVWRTNHNHRQARFS